MPAPELLLKAKIPPVVLEVLAQLQKRGHQALLVGGSIRDILRGLPPKDFDVATSATPAQVQAAFKRVIPTGIEHGTVTVLVQNLPLEVTTFRSEGAYVDGRRPSNVTFEQDVDADLSRRDFTVNAMAYDPLQHRLHDPFGGQADLEARIIRCVGLPEARFGEDGLRALRAVRFATVLEFELDPATERAIPPTLPIFKKISRERIRDEIQKLLLGRLPSRGLILLQDTGLLEVISPRLNGHPDTQHRVNSIAPELELRLATWMDTGMEPSAQAEVLDGLRLPRKTAERIQQWLRHPFTEALAQETDAGLRRYLASLGPEHLPAVAALALARPTHSDPAHTALWSNLRDRLVAVVHGNPPLSVRDLALNGQQIMQTLGRGPGPHIGRASRFLLDQVLEDPARNSLTTLQQLLAEWGRTQDP